MWITILYNYIVLGFVIRKIVQMVKKGETKFENGSGEEIVMTQIM